jgi:hypothetical protein
LPGGDHEESPRLVRGAAAEEGDGGVVPEGGERRESRIPAEGRGATLYTADRRIVKYGA